MKRTPAALVLNKTHHLHQVLFLALALLLTLVASQLYNTWEVKQTHNRLADQIVRIHESRAQFQAVPLQTAPLMRSRALPAATSQAVAPSERWVF